MAADCLWLSDGSAVSCHVVASFFCAGIEWHLSLRLSLSLSRSCTCVNLEQLKRSTPQRNMLFIDSEPDQPHWGWSWMDRWMAARPWENQNLDPLKDGCSQAIPSMKSSLEARTKHVDKHVVVDSGTGDMRLKVGGGGKSSTKKGEEKQHKDSLASQLPTVQCTGKAEAIPLPLPSPPCLPAAVSMPPKGPTSTEQTTTLPTTAVQMLPLSADASFSLAVDENTGVTLPPPPEHLSSLKVPLPSDDLLPSETYALKNMTTNGVTPVHISMGCNGAGEHQEDKSAGKLSLQQSPAGNQPLRLKTHDFLIFTQALNLWASVRKSQYYKLLSPDSRSPEEV